MSSIGKLFIVLNLILAAAFLGWAASALTANNEFKSKYDSERTTHVATKAELEAKAAKLTADVQDQTSRANALLRERDEQRNRADRLQDDFNAKREENSQMRADLDKIAATLQGMDETKNRLQADKDRAQQAQRDSDEAKRVAEAAREAAVAKAGQLELALQKAGNDIADLEKRSTALAADKQSLETQLATLVANTGAKVSDFAPLPKIDGRVLDVSMAVEPGLVAINKGEADGVKRGYTFELYDGATYKGQVRIEFVHGNMASGLITRKVKGQTVRQGDGASTRL